MRILIADDHAIVRNGLRQLLEKEIAFVFIEEVDNAEDLLKKASQSAWDMIITDLSMPGRSGLDALIQLKQQFPKLPVLVLSMYPEEQYAIRVIKAGAAGYLSKGIAKEELMNAVRRVITGKKYITPTLAEQLASQFDLETTLSQHQLLSDREFDVFKLLAVGKSVSEIGDSLSLSSSTISTYRSRIMEKMNMRTNADLTRYALDNKLI